MIGGPVTVTADPDRVAQVVGNLLDHVVRAVGPHGAVRVEVGTDLSTEGTRTAVLEVLDDRPGIPAPERQRVFERLIRLEDGHQTADGAGLGLSIARGIARAHGGDLVAAEPLLGAGARLRLTLPAVPPP